MSRVVLPVSEPVLNAYPEVGQVFSIIDYEDEKSLQWMYSNFVQLYVHHKRRMTYVESLPLHYTAGHKVPTLYHYCFGRQMIDKKYESFCRFLMESISDGYYCSTVLDRFYLSGSANYEVQHKYHNTLFYGYDADARIFFGRDNEGKYIDREYSFDELENAYIQGFNSKDPGDNADGAVMLVKRMGEVLYQFNVSYLINELEFYLNSYGSELCEHYNVVHHYRAQIPRVQIKYFNMGVYDYFRAMLTDPEPVGGINVIAAYVLWEHKAFMEKRVKFLIERGYLDRKSDLLDAAICIREKAENIQNMILKIVELYQAQETAKMVIAMMRGTELIDEIEKLEKSFIRNLIDALKANSH